MIEVSCVTELHISYVGSSFPIVHTKMFLVFYRLHLYIDFTKEYLMSNVLIFNKSIR